MDYVLTERFCQDPVEEVFGKQGQLGRRSDNPEIYQFSYNSNAIRIERSISYQSRNTRGKRSWDMQQMRNCHAGKSPKHS